MLTQPPPLLIRVNHSSARFIPYLNEFKVIDLNYFFYIPQFLIPAIALLVAGFGRYIAMVSFNAKLNFRNSFDTALRVDNLIICEISRELKHVGRQHDDDGNQYNESMKRNK
jgi:hypothetical protein